MTIQRQPGAPLTERGRRTRQALIDAAIDVFYEQGYFSTRLSAITERVGCSTGTLYTYFANRQEILAAIIEESYAPVVAADRAWGDPDHDPGTDVPGPEALIAKIRKATGVYVRRYRDNAREVVRQCGWHVIRCAEGDNPRSVEEIHREVWDVVKGLL